MSKSGYTANHMLFKASGYVSRFYLLKIFQVNQHYYLVVYSLKALKRNVKLKKKPNFHHCVVFHLEEDASSSILI